MGFTPPATLLYFMTTSSSSSSVVVVVVVVVAVGSNIVRVKPSSQVKFQTTYDMLRYDF